MITKNWHHVVCPLLCLLLWLCLITYASILTPTPDARSYGILWEEMIIFLHWLINAICDFHLLGRTSVWAAKYKPVIVVSPYDLTCLLLSFCDAHSCVYVRMRLVFTFRMRQVNVEGHNKMETSEFWFYDFVWYVIEFMFACNGQPFLSSLDLADENCGHSSKLVSEHIIIIASGTNSKATRNRPNHV